MRKKVTAAGEWLQKELIIKPKDNPTIVTMQLNQIRPIQPNTTRQKCCQKVKVEITL